LLFTLPVLAATINREGDDYAITTPVYNARINGKSGLLDRLTIGNTVAVAQMAIDLERRAFTRVDVTQESPTRVVVNIAATEQNGQMVEKALRLAYTAEDSTLHVRVLATVGNVAGRGPSFTLGPEVQMVRSLEYKETIPMPDQQGHTPWQRVKFYYASGATLGILNEGAGNPYNPNENGGVGGYTYARSGYVANSEYTYTLIAEQGNHRTIGSPPMTITEATTPAVYWQGDPIQATLTIKKAFAQRVADLPGLRVKYEVQDAFEHVAAQGEIPLDLSAGGDITLKVPLPVTRLGWYRAYFTVNDAHNSLLEGKDRLIFSVLHHQPDMGERFENQLQTDYTLGLGLMRESMNPADIRGVQEVVRRRREEVKGADTHYSFAIDGSPVGNDPKRFGEVCFSVFDAVKDDVPRVEIINEPNGTLQPKEYVETFLRPAYENIKKASPKTRVIGPVLCGIGPDQARYLQELYRLGLKGLTDELSFHPYAGNFDDGSAVAEMQRLQQIIATNGDGTKPVAFTESGYSHGGWSDLRDLREIIKLAVAQYAWQNAVMGIDHWHNYYYFTDSMGYLDMWLRANQLTPAAVALRTYTGFVKSQERAQRLDFGSLDAVRAFRYPGPAHQVVVLWTAGNYLPTEAPDPTTTVTFTTNAKTVNWYDCFGNPLPAVVKRGKLTLPVGTYPSYLVLPPAAKLAPAPEQWGADVALSALGAVAEASSEIGTNPALSAIDGNPASDSAWRSQTPNELPQTLTVTLAGPTPVNRVGIWGYSPRGYNVAVRDAGGAWRQVAARRDQPYQRFRTVVFPTVVTDQVRVTVVDSYTDRAEIAEFQVFSPSAKPGATLELVNWALQSNGATARASSTMRKEVTIAEQDWGAKQPRLTKVTLEGKAENVIDGKHMISGWRDFFPTTWVAAEGEALPQWLEIDFAGAKTLHSITVYTIAFSGWTPANSGIRAWDVQVWDGKGWQTVDQVTNNERVSKTTRLKTPLTTEKIRIVVTATNDPEGTIGVMEVEAFGPKN